MAGGLGAPPSDEIRTIALYRRAIPLSDVRFYANATVGVVASSLNYQISGNCADALNAYHGHPHVNSVEANLDWIEWYLEKNFTPDFGWCGHEHDSHTYGWIWRNPVRAARALAIKLGNRQKLVALCDRWLFVFAVRQIVGFYVPWKGAQLSQTEMTKPAPCAQFADQPPTARSNKYEAGSCEVGCRATSRKNSLLDTDDVGDVDLPSVMEILGRAPMGEDGMTYALKVNGWDYLWPLTDAQVETLRVAALCDESPECLAAMREAWSWIADVPLRFPVHGELRRGGKVCWMAKSPDGTTPPLNAHSIERPTGGRSYGFERMLFANDGGRDTKANPNHIKPSECWESEGGENLLAQRVDRDYPPVSMPKPAGPTVARWYADPSGHHWVLPAGSADVPPAPDPDPIPAPSPAPAPVPWWRRLLAWLISAVRG